MPGFRSYHRQRKCRFPPWRDQFSGCRAPLRQGASAKSLYRASRPISKTRPSAWRRQFNLLERSAHDPGPRGRARRREADKAIWVIEVSETPLTASGRWQLPVVVGQCQRRRELGHAPTNCEHGASGARTDHHPRIRRHGSGEALVQFARIPENPPMRLDNSTGRAIIIAGVS